MPQQILVMWAFTRLIGFTVNGTNKCINFYCDNINNNKRNNGVNEKTYSEMYENEFFYIR